MMKFSLWGKLLALCLALLLAACGGGGGGNGSSADAPTGFTVTPANGQAIVTWNAAAGVDYWLMYAATSAGIDIKNPPGGHVWKSSVTTPYVVALTNGTAYSFAMNARTGGGPGGPQTASVTVTPGYAGTTWVAGTGAAGALNGVTYGTSSADTLPYFVAVGDSGGIYKAADGVSQSVTGYTWSQVHTGPSVDFKAATYALSNFIAVGAGGVSNNIYYSSDLATWTAASTLINTGMNAVAFDGTNLVAVGDGGKVYYSTNGSVWTAAATTNTAANLYGVAYSSGNATWVAVGANGTLITSTNLITWTPQVSNAGTQTLRSVAATSASVIVAVGDAGTVVSSNSVVSSWSLRNPGTSNALNAVSTDSTQFVAVGAGGKEFTSPDGVTWTAALTNGTTAALMAVVGSASKYVAVGLTGATVSSIH